MNGNTGKPKRTQFKMPTFKKPGISDKGYRQPLNKILEALSRRFPNTPPEEILGNLRNKQYYGQKRGFVDPRSLDTGIPQQYYDDEYLQKALQLAGIKGMPAWMSNQYALDPNADIGQDLYTALLDYDVSGNLDDEQTIGMIPDALEYLSNGGVTGLSPIRGKYLKPTIDALPVEAQAVLASEMRNGLTTDALKQIIKPDVDLANNSGYSAFYGRDAARSLSNKLGLDIFGTENSFYGNQNNPFEPGPQYSTPIDRLTQTLRNANQYEYAGLGEINNYLKDVEGIDYLSEIAKNGPIPPTSELFSYPDKTPLNYDGSSVSLPTATIPMTESATAPNTAAGGGGATIPPNNDKGLKGFFQNAKRNTSNTWNNKVKPTASGMWNGKIKPGINSVWQYMKAHPGMSAGLGITGAANLAGLFDNTKVGGQLLGAGLGAGIGYGLLPKLAGAISPQAQLLTTLTGGSLGALFDNLRAKQEKEREQQRYAYR